MRNMTRHAEMESTSQDGGEGQHNQTQTQYRAGLNSCPPRTSLCDLT